MDSFLDSSFAMGNADILQSIATMVWANSGDPAMAEKVASARLGYEIYQRMSGAREVDALQNQTIMAICKYVKDHPNAKKEDLQKELARQIFAFANKVDKM